MAGYSIGEAFVLDNSPMLNNIGRQIERTRQEGIARQKKLDEENGVLLAQMNKINAKGIDRTDLPEFNSKYSAVKDAYYKYRSAKNDSERMAAKMAVDDAFKDTMQYADTAVTSRREVAKYATEALRNPDKYQDGYATKVANELKKPVSKINYDLINPLMQERKVDVSKVQTKLDTINRNLLGAMDFKQAKSAGKQGNREGTLISQSREVPREIQMARYKAEYDSDPALRYFLKQQYPTLAPDQQIAALAETQRTQGYLSEKKVPTFSPNARPRSSGGGAGGGAAGSTGDTLPRDVATGLVNKDPEWEARAKAWLPEGSTVGWSSDGKSFTIDIPSGRTPKGERRFGVKRTFSGNNPNMQDELAYFLKQTDIGTNAPWLQKVYKDKGKPATQFRPLDKPNPKQPAANPKLRQETVNFFKKK